LEVTDNTSSVHALPLFSYYNLAMIKQLGLVLVVFCSFASNCVAQKKANTSTHGTVNILLANKNGMVLVTDSRLSNEHQQPVGEGPKLFVLDDHTICSIADFYSDPGPLTNGQMPAYTDAPGILKTLLKKFSIYPNKPKESVSLKLDDLINIYSFTLSTIANLNSVSDPKKVPSGAQLTIAGYEGKELHVSQATLKPVWSSRNIWEYEELDKKDRVVGDALLTRFAGITKIADAVLADPNEQSVKNDPILSNFTTEIARNKGQDLSVEDLRQTAVQLKVRTSNSDRYRNIVGGKTQSITMSDGHMLSQDLLDNQTDPVGVGGVAVPLVCCLTFDAPVGSDVQIYKPADRGKGLSALFVDVRFRGGQERLDGNAYVRSKFENCKLTYDGTGPVFFDDQNTVINSTLEVGKGVKENDEILFKLKKYSPNLKVVKRNDVKTGSN
jgi:hypothetical protein